MIQIIDNFLNDDVNKKLESELIHSNFPWYCMNNVTSDDFKNFAFFHQFVDDSKVNSNSYDSLVMPVINEIVDKKLIDTNYVCKRIKANLYTNQGASKKQGKFLGAGGLKRFTRARIE